MDDEEFARQLQEEEYREQRRRIEAQNLADEEFARKLAVDNQMPRPPVPAPAPPPTYTTAAAYYQHPPNIPPQQSIQQPPYYQQHVPQQQPPAQNSFGGSAVTTTLRSGQSIAVKLQHGHSMNQINEAVYAHFADSNILQLELLSRRNHFMRVNDVGLVEFSQQADENSKFIVENADQGNIYLSCRGKRTALNVNGGVGWSLALTREGTLVGNYGKGPLSQWKLIAADQQPSQPQNIQYPAVSTPASQRANNDSNTDSQFADLSDVDKLWRWLGSDSGQQFLTRNPALLELYRGGSLRKVLHRPDWPYIALEWRDYSKFDFTSHFSLIQLNPTDNGHFGSQGYLKISGAIPHVLLENAQKIVNFWIGHHRLPPVNLAGSVELSGDILHDISVMNLLYKSSLVEVIGDLGLRGKLRSSDTCHAISVKFPLLTDLSSKNAKLSGRRWFVEKNVNRSTGGVLIAIPLTYHSSSRNNSADPKFAVFPNGYEEILTSPSGRLSDYDIQHVEMDLTKADLGEPTLLTPTLSEAGGDAFIFSPRIPRRELPNYSPQIEITVYFKIEEEI